MWELGRFRFVVGAGVGQNAPNILAGLGLLWEDQVGLVRRGKLRCSII
jgi:hypothetical protein